MMANPGDFVETMVFDPKNSNTIYLGSVLPGGWKSSNGGNTWIPLANGLQSHGYGFIIDPDNTQIIYAANAAAGVVESLDAGASWTSISTGIQGQYVRSIAVASRNPLTIYAGVYGAGIYKMTRTKILDYGISINGGALYTNQTGATLTLTAPPGTSQMLISNDGGFGEATWEAFANSKPWTITAYGAYAIPRTVYAKFKTNGQISGQYQDDIVLDQTPPTGTIQIVDTAANTMASPTTSTVYPSAKLPTTTATHITYLPLVAKNYVPGFRVVGLSLSATDDLSGVSDMLISNNAAFVGSQWQAYAKKLNWYANERGTTTIYVKYRDRAGNESQLYSTVTTTP
jgi:hypothetical protein